MYGPISPISAEPSLYWAQTQLHGGAEKLWKVPDAGENEHVQPPPPTFDSFMTKLEQRKENNAVGMIPIRHLGGYLNTNNYELFHISVLLFAR